MTRAARSYLNAWERWARVGPYYAMFPVAFADEVVRRYTNRGDWVIDPFAGRGTAVFSAAANGRHGLGIEINPVGWVYAKAKLRPASKRAVADRIEEIGRRASDYGPRADRLPEFFRHCFTRKVRKFLLAARALLNWRRSAVDRTLMALLLVNLHGKRDASLSNQMRQTKSLYPDYAIRWWKARRMAPPDVDPVAFMLGRLRWRYAKGRPTLQGSKVYLGDSVQILTLIKRRAAKVRAKLLLTSPPYFAVTNYHHDQWLRLWLLGGRPDALRVGGRHRAKFEDRTRYRDMLHQVFGKAAKLLAKDATVYVRTDSRSFTLETTVTVLREVFPNKLLVRRVRPLSGPTQTALFGDRSTKSGEVDLILYPKRA